MRARSDTARWERCFQTPGQEELEPKGKGLESVAVAFQIWMFDIFLLSQPLGMLLMSIILLYLLKAIEWASLGGSALKFRGRANFLALPKN